MVRNERKLVSACCPFPPGTVNQQLAPMRFVRWLNRAINDPGGKWGAISAVEIEVDEARIVQRLLCRADRIALQTPEASVLRLVTLPRYDDDAQ